MRWLPYDTLLHVLDRGWGRGLCEVFRGSGAGQLGTTSLAHMTKTTHISASASIHAADMPHASVATLVWWRWYAMTYALQ
jgi:hypothetical protein